jgi:mono/diheme cytochrome c family protein
MRGLWGLLALGLVCQFGCAPGARESEAGAGTDAGHGSAVEAISEGEARRLYTLKCSLCHGPDGRLGASRATDLSTSTMGVDQRIGIIKYGKGLMPPQASLSKAELLGLALYLEGLRQ